MITTPLEFFKWAFEDLPSDHYIVGVYLDSFINKDNKKISYAKNNNLKDPSQAANFTNKFVKLKKETFYALGMFNNNWESVAGKEEPKITRTKKDAKFFRVIAFDVDVGKDKNYADFISALGPTVTTLNKIGVQKQEYTIVKSGYGMHVYFKFNQLVPKIEWEAIGAKLKHTLIKLGLHIDPTKCGEAAMILRAPGSYNFKNPEDPKLVEVKHLATESITTEYLLNLLNKHEDKDTTQLDLVTTNEMLPGSIIELEDVEYTKRNHEEVIESCNQLKALVKDCNVSEPLWYAALGIAAYTEKAREAAILLSKNNKSYNEHETLSKMNQWMSSATGPATCEKFNTLNPDGCASCPFKNKIKTPLQIRPKDQVAKQITGPRQQVYVLPPYYVYTETKGIAKTNGEVFIPVVDYEFCLDGIAMKEDRRDPSTYLRFHINLPKRGWKYLEVEISSLFGNNAKGENFQVKCTQMGVVMQKKSLGLLQEYAIDAVTDYLKNKDVSKICEQMGWTKEETFIWGNKELKGEGIPPEYITPYKKAMISSAKSMTTEGDLDVWLQQVQVLAQEGLENHAFAYLIGFAAPLYKHTLLGGVTINLYSEWSGRGKTTACNYALSIYGNPNLMCGTHQDTIASLLSKMSAYNNIPLLMDEISDSKGFAVSDLLYTVSSGKERSRSDREGELRDSKHWNTILLTTSNKSLYDKLDEHTASSSGQKNRLLEIDMSADVLDKDIAQQINITLGSNHGLAAEMYLNKLIELNQDGELVEKVQKGVDRFCHKFKFDFEGQERFVGGIFACAYLGARIAQELGLCPSFNLDRIFKVVLNHVSKNRIHLQNAVESVEDVLNLFLLTHNQHFVKIVHDENGGGEYGIHKYRAYESSAPSGQIVGRIMVKYKDRNVSNLPYYGQVAIEVNAFKLYCRKNNKPFHKYLDEFTTFRNYVRKSINFTEDVVSAVDHSPVIPIRMTGICFDLPVQLLDKIRASPPNTMIVDKQDAEIEGLAKIREEDISFNFGANIQ